MVFYYVYHSVSLRRHISTFHMHHYRGVQCASLARPFCIGNPPDHLTPAFLNLLANLSRLSRLSSVLCPGNNLDATISMPSPYLRLRFRGFEVCQKDSPCLVVPNPLILFSSATALVLTTLSETSFSTVRNPPHRIASLQASLSCPNNTILKALQRDFRKNA